jgi:hypothetical protein
VCSLPASLSMSVFLLVFLLLQRRGEGGRERYKSGRPPLPQSSGQAGTCARSTATPGSQNYANNAVANRMALAFDNGSQMGRITRVMRSKNGMVSLDAAKRGPWFGVVRSEAIQTVRPP